MKQLLNGTRYYFIPWDISILHAKKEGKYSILVFYSLLDPTTVANTSNTPLTRSTYTSACLSYFQHHEKFLDSLGSILVFFNSFFFNLKKQLIEIIVALNVLVSLATDSSLIGSPKLLLVAYAKFVKISFG